MIPAEGDSRNIWNFYLPEGRQPLVPHLQRTLTHIAHKVKADRFIQDGTPAMRAFGYSATAKYAGAIWGCTYKPNEANSQ